MTIQEVVAENVRQIRKKRKMSQEGLAHEADLSRTYMGEIERAEKVISIVVLEQLADALNVDPATLVTPRKKK